MSLSIRRFLIAAGTAIIILAVIWWALWSMAAVQFRSVIDGWIEKGRAAGYQIVYDDEQLFGFPRHIVVRFQGLHWKNTDGILFHAASIDISAEPWRWQHFDARFKPEVELNAPLEGGQQSLALGGEDGKAHVELDGDGNWIKARLSLVNARFGRAPDYLFLARRLETSAERPSPPPASHKDVGLTLVGNAEDMVLPSAMPTPFGPKMAKLAIDMRVMGAVPDVRLKNSVAAWNKDSGVVQFERLDMDWGPMVLRARGTMGFDDDLQPEGAFSGAVSGHEAVLKALMDNGFIAAHQESMLNSALSLFARPSKDSNTPGIEIPITVQLGGLFLGPVRIFTFPEIEWPQEVPK